MLEKTLHTGNIAAAFGTLATTAADLTVFGGTATVIGGIFSGLAIFKKDPAAANMVEQMGTAFEAAAKASPLSDDRKKLIPQIMQKYPVTEGDIAAGNLVAAQVAAIIRARVDDADAADPALRNAAVLDAYEAILTLTLEPVLTAPGGLDPMQAAALKELLIRSASLSERERRHAEAQQLMLRHQFEELLDVNRSSYSEMNLLLQHLHDCGVTIKELRKMLGGNGND